MTGEPANPPIPVPDRRRRWPYLIALPLGAAILVWSLNYMLVQRGVSQALNSDARNAGYSISAHYRFYVEPSTLVLDLRDVSAAAPLHLFRGLFQSATALESAGWRIVATRNSRLTRAIHPYISRESAGFGQPASVFTIERRLRPSEVFSRTSSGRRADGGPPGGRRELDSEARIRSGRALRSTWVYFERPLTPSFEDSDCSSKGHVAVEGTQ